MVQDDLERRAADAPVPSTMGVRRAVEIVAVGLMWGLPGALLGLLVCALSMSWPEMTGWFALFGTLVGAVAGMWLEAASDSLDLPMP